MIDNEYFLYLFIMKSQRIVYSINYQRLKKIFVIFFFWEALGRYNNNKLNYLESWVVVYKRAVREFLDGNDDEVSG